MTFCIFLNFVNKDCLLGCYDNTFFQCGKRTLPGLFLLLPVQFHRMMGASALFGEDTLAFYFFKDMHVSKSSGLCSLGYRFFPPLNYNCAMPFLVVHFILLPLLLDLCISFSH